LTTAPSDTAATALANDLAAVVGRPHVLTAEEDRLFFSHDISGPAPEPAACVVAPGTVEELARAVAASTAAGFAVVPRGGGASYTGGYRPARARSVLVDTRRLDRIVEVSAADMYVTVECGCTWKSLFLALRAKGLRTPFWGPLSGATATVGGSLSQNAILWGSARYGVSAESVLGLEVVTADGSVLPTGSAAGRNARPFFRYYGPDLTGLFLGDTGALGIKARAALKLIPLPSSVETASFGFDTREAMVAAMARIAREGLATECFGMDPVLQHQRMKRASLAKDLGALKGVATSQGSLVSGVIEAAKVVAAGRSFLDGVAYSMHVGTEGRDEAAVRATIDEIRRACAAEGGREVENTVPKVLRGDPFVPMTTAIGPEGERWLPVHGVVPLSDAAPAWSAVSALLAERRPAFDRHGIVVGVLTAVVGSSAFVLEPVFYWPGPRTLYYRRVLDPADLARFREFPESPEAMAVVGEARRALARLFLERGAAHLQIGKTYLYREGRRPEAWRLLEAVKNAVDPQRLMNPGSLGLD
jgi:FAD/FMN-containing dehydrogenase